MIVRLQNIAKRYTTNWIFKSINYSFDKPICYGLSGPNGSGKSTLIQILSGYLSPTQGTVNYHHNGGNISRDDIYKEISITAPYIDLIEDFSIRELFDLFAKFKGFRDDVDYRTFLNICQLKKHQSKRVKQFSSGMKQRLKLSFCITLNSSLLLLDEPSSYFDTNTKQWFYRLLREFGENKLIVMASNEPEDLEHCEKIVEIEKLSGLL